MNIHNTQSNKQVFFSLEFVNILLQMEAKAVKNASSLLHFSGHRELESGLFYNQTQSQSRNEINTHAEHLVQKHIDFKSFALVEKKLFGP